MDSQHSSAAPGSLSRKCSAQIRRLFVCFFWFFANPEHQMELQVSHPGSSPGFSGRYEHAPSRCDRNDALGGCGERTKAEQRGCFEIHQFSSKLGPAAHGGSRAAFGDEPVQELWEPHGGVGN